MIRADLLRLAWHDEIFQRLRVVQGCDAELIHEAFLLLDKLRRRLPLAVAEFAMAGHIGAFLRLLLVSLEHAHALLVHSADGEAGASHVARSALLQDQPGLARLRAGLERLVNQLLGQVESRRLVCLLYTSPSPRDGLLSRMPSSA